MADRLSHAREAIQRATDVADNATVRKQLRSIDEGLMEMTERDDAADAAAKTEGDRAHGDDLEEVENRLADLASEAEGAAQRHVEDARSAIDAHRRAHTRDW